MAQFLQQNWIWVLLIGVMVLTHLRGHGHGGHSGHAGCGHAAHRPEDHERRQEHGSSVPESSPEDLSPTSTSPALPRDAS